MGVHGIDEHALPKVQDGVAEEHNLENRKTETRTICDNILLRHRAGGVVASSVM